ncbi:hypothetical protein TRVL_07444 [Trypanosoma vivax]|nr:hypothetical protein TRVL_07444 [Trypanosoma vivax]
MFSVEFTRGRSFGSSPYYSLVVREPYIVGRDETSDIVLDCIGIAEQHASFTVLRRSQSYAQVLGSATHAAATQVDGEEEGETNEEVGANDAVDGSFLHDTNGISTPAERDWPADVRRRPRHMGKRDAGPSNVEEKDPLVVCVTNLGQGGYIKVVGGAEVLDEPVILSDGAELILGDEVCLRLRFRPLIVSISRSGLTAEHVHELESMYFHLGATLTRSAGPTLQLNVPLPIGKLLCTSVLSDDDPACLSALACGYSIVQLSYVFEWFSALAQSAASPLSSLPPPVRFEVPIRRRHSSMRRVLYLRPESDVSPFPLYPIPSTATVQRSRSSLFSGLTFVFLTNSLERRYSSVVQLCGGGVQRLEELAIMIAEGKKENARGGRKADAVSTLVEASCHVVVGAEVEQSLQDGFCAAHVPLRQLLDDALSAGMRIPIVAEHSLFHSLLANKVSMVEVAWLRAGETVNSGSHSPAVARSSGRRTGSVRRCDKTQGSPAKVKFRLPRHATKSIQKNAGSGKCAKTEAGVNASSSSSRKKGWEEVPQTPQRRGTRQHTAESTPTSCASRLCSVSQLGEVLIQRVRAFTRREQPRLAEILVASKRNLFLDPSAEEYVVECCSQTKRFICKMENLLAQTSKGSQAMLELGDCVRSCRQMLGSVRAILETATSAQRRKMASARSSMSLAEGDVGQLASSTTSRRSRRATSPAHSAYTCEETSASHVLHCTAGGLQSTPQRGRRTASLLMIPSPGTKQAKMGPRLGNSVQHQRASSQASRSKIHDPIVLEPSILFATTATSPRTTLRTLQRPPRVLSPGPRRVVASARKALYQDTPITGPTTPLKVNRSSGHGFSPAPSPHSQLSRRPTPQRRPVIPHSGSSPRSDALVRHASGPK